MSENTLRVELKVNFDRESRGRKRLAVGRKPEPDLPEGRLPRLSRLMALAIRFDHLIREGEISDYAEIARLGHITRARVTQVMNLLLLAPDIQDEILHLPLVQKGRDPIAEHDLRSITAVIDWKKQRRLWRELHGDKMSTPDIP